MYAGFLNEPKCGDGHLECVSSYSGQLPAFIIRIT